MISIITMLSTKTTKLWNSQSYLDPTNAMLLRLSASFTHLLAKNQVISFSTPSKATEYDLQERQGDVTVDLCLDGDLDFEVKVKTELQGCGRGNSLALRAANDLSTEDGRGLGRCEFGLWGRHGDAEERVVNLLRLLYEFRHPSRIRTGARATL